MRLASFCACAIHHGRLMTYKHTNTVGIDLANTGLAALAPIRTEMDSRGVCVKLLVRVVNGRL